MATSTTVDEAVLSLLSKSFSSAGISPDLDVVKLSAAAYPDTHLTEREKTELSQWLITSSHLASPTEDQAKQDERLSSLNTHLAFRTTILGSKPSVADVALYLRLKDVVSKWSSEERTGEMGYHHIVRYLDFVQNAPVFGLKLSDSEKVSIDQNDVVFKIKPIDAKAEKERKKKEKEAAAVAAASVGATPTDAAGKAGKEAAESSKKSKKENIKGADEAVSAAAGAETPTAKQGQKKEKKPKQPKPQKQAAPEKPLSPCLIDLRVGHILKAVNHPDAEKLYVSTIACGDAPGTDNTSEYEGQVVRTVCSGLNGLVPLEEMQGRKVIAVCNLKPVTMRGIKSAAMVLAASPRNDDSHGGPVELVTPPEGASAGDRVFFEGWEGEPEPVLNPKKKVWEMIQPGLTTTEDLEVGFEMGEVPQLSGEGADKKTGLGKLKTKDGICTVKSLKGATVR